MLESKFKVLLSTIPIALLGVLVVLMVHSAPLPAAAQQAGQETFFEEAVRTANASGAAAAPATTTASATEGTPAAEGAAPTTTTGPSAAAEAGSEQRGGGGAAAAAAELLRQGQISSALSDVPGREDTQSVVIVPARDDNAVLSGILTYHASRPVDLFVWNKVNLENKTAIPEEFGDIGDIVNVNNKTFSLADVSSGPSGSVPFTGNAVELVGEEDPFIVTYSLNAVPALANIVSDLQSLNSFNATAADEGDDAGDDDDEG